MKKIVLIEDNQQVRENTAEILELASYNVLTAENGKIGVEMINQELPDLIICDIMMPELDGYGVLHIISKNNQTAKIPLIFLTAKAEREDLRKGMNMGADDYLTKPFDESELLDAVESRLRKSEILRIEYDQNAAGLNQFIEEVRNVGGLQELSIDRRVRSYKKKSNVYMEGDTPINLVLINTGKIKTYRTNEDGKELITGTFVAGDYIGYNPLIQGSEYSESAMTLEESEICLIPKDDFFKLLYSSRDVSNKFIKMLSNNLDDREEKLLHLAYNTVRQRVAEVLLKLHAQTEKKELGYSISRDDLANMVGTATESVIRSLSDFKEEKLIDIKSGKIFLLSVSNLENLVKRGF
jgi:DNA-binding response OmpR family regulator